MIFVDIAQGHSAGVIRMVEKIKARHRVQVVAGNVVTASGTEDLIAAGADGIKIGVGPGAICTTRVVAGAGMPQVTAIFDCANAAAGSNAEARTTETARRKEMKRNMMQHLMEGGIRSILKIRCRNENDNAKLRASANAIT